MNQDICTKWNNWMLYDRNYWNFNLVHNIDLSFFFWYNQEPASHLRYPALWLFYIQFLYFFLNSPSFLAPLNSNFNNFGNWNPTVEHGTITGSSCQYYKIGKLVTLFCAIWGGGDGTDNIVTLSLPFPSISIRAYGSVGFFPGAVNYPNLHVIIAEGGNLIFEYSDGDNIKHINGKQWGTCQFSITYLTNWLTNHSKI